MFGASTDPADEWRDLREHYAHLSNEGLQAAADEAYNLTDIARSVLRNEIQSRRLEIQLKDSYQPPPSPQGDLDPSDIEAELVVLSQVWSEDEARRVKEVLDAALIPSYLGPNNTDQIGELRASYDQGVEVKVWQADRQRGLWALKRLADESPVEQSPEYTPECPRCRSPEIVFCGLDAEPAMDGSIPDSQFNWRCDACGNQWKDDGVEDHSTSANSA